MLVTTGETRHEEEEEEVEGDFFMYVCIRVYSLTSSILFVGHSKISFFSFFLFGGFPPTQRYTVCKYHAIAMREIVHISRSSSMVDAFSNFSYGRVGGGGGSVVLLRMMTMKKKDFGSSIFGPT